MFMTHHTLREVSKFLSGMVAAKILFVFWFTAAGLTPLILAGTPFTANSVGPAMIFNVALLAVLVYYGWHVKSPVHSPTERKLLGITGAIFLVVSCIHAARLLFGWQFIVGDLVVPLWLSWLGVLFTAYLSYASFHLAARMRRN
jgi:hypothetical protein